MRSTELAIKGMNFKGDICTHIFTCTNQIS